MGASVCTFSRAHPSDDASYDRVLERLEDTIARIADLAKQQEDGFVAKHAAAVRRQDVRRRLQAGLVRHLVTAARHARSEAPSVTEKFRVPSSNATYTTFRTAVSEMLDQARTNQELLVQHGLSPSLLDEIGAALVEYDAAGQEADVGKQSHVAAGARMQTLSGEIMRLVDVLDGFNRSRFHREPDLLVAWRSAKHVVSGSQPRDASPPAGGERTAA